MKRPARERVSAYFYGFDISGVIISGDWEGDPDVPNGTREIDPYVEDLEIKNHDGTDMYEHVSDKFIEMCETKLLEG
ncbi:hypothetical protein B4O97_03555 [Marispirochaeta aestuarii]|uniref:Uncharacterized protein n=1 Tax=Marispirochaeta aestuarii TaxID=1963862 RepID=A0A1Y1S1A6_9SPIO|nr:hypothetical protein [Marispirochaeta aestuarii]ORC37279.1 hypothetical protein B4O97_03555 [Marispirochaeta aestuarii]